MLRHSVLWILRDPTDAEGRLAMLQRLAYLGTECPTVRSGDYGADLFGGSEPLHEVRPSQRTPVWRRREAGPPCDFDLALHLDFEDWDGFRAYGNDPTHNAASESNEAASWDELTARVRWEYEGEVPPTRAGLVKHVAMFVWADDASEADRVAAVIAAEGLAEADGTGAVLVGHNSGTLSTDYDWILDVELADAEAARTFLDSDAYREAMEPVARATKHEWTARLSHVMHRP